MARTFKEIEETIIKGLRFRDITLNSSKVAEWRIWTSVFAGVIYSFEQMLEVFRRNVENHKNLTCAGKAEWYATMVRRYQHGHTLMCNKDTYEVFYETEDDESKIIKQVAVKEIDNSLLLKIAGHDENGKIVQLTLDQAKGVRAYVEYIKFVGTNINILSQNADCIRYNIAVYCKNEAIPEKVYETVKKGLELFKSSLEFDSKLYQNKLLSAIMAMDDVVTVEIVSLERKSYMQEEYIPVGIVDTMDAGYFEYSDDSTLIVKRLNDITDEN